MVPISRSTNGCEPGMYGTDLISSMSRTRKLASQRWNRKSGSWSVLTCLGRLWAALTSSHAVSATCQVNRDVFVALNGLRIGLASPLFLPRAFAILCLPLVSNLVRRLGGCVSRIAF